MKIMKRPLSVPTHALPNAVRHQVRLILARPRPQRGNLSTDLLPLPPPPAQHSGLPDSVIVLVVLVHLSPLAVVDLRYARPARVVFEF